MLQFNHEISIQLRELIKRNDKGADLRRLIANQPNAEHENESTSDYTPGSLLTPGSPIDDNASFKTAVSSFSIRSMSRSMKSLLLLPFTEDLQDSRAYKRTKYFRRGEGSSCHSVISLNTPSMKGDTWSILSISEISVVGLPICLADLHDHTPFQQTATKKRRALLHLKWSFRGSLHNAIRDKVW